MEFPADWVHHFGVNLVSAFPPGLGARFRWHERLRPQPRFSSIVELALASDPDFRVHDIEAMTKLVTAEGEYGAWVAIAGQRLGRDAQRFVGAVFLGEFASALDVIAVIPKHFAVVRQLSFELLRAASFDLARRPRRFFYTPPADWQGVPSGATANWYPLDFPKNLTNIVVPPARYVEADAEPLIEAARAELGLGLDGAEPTRDVIASTGGNPGAYLRFEGTRAGRRGPVFRELAIFVVASHAYRMRLESASADRVGEMREVLRGVASSFEPLPDADESRAGRALTSVPALFDHWAT